MEQIPDTFAGLFWGYTVIWGLIVTYLVYLGIRLSKLESKLSKKK